MTDDFTMLEALLHRRHSCRAFLPDPVPEQITERIVAAAGRVPSWCNAQPWQITVTRPEETERLREALHETAATTEEAPDIAFPSAYQGVYKERRATCGWALYAAVGVQRGDRDASRRQMMENFRFFGAPHFGLVTTDAALGPYSLLDCGAFVTAFTLAAEAQGVASIPQAAVAGFAPMLRDWFAVPEDRQIVCGISFGYADAAHTANSFRTERAPLAEILRWR